jgi:hypothetical protein
VEVEKLSNLAGATRGWMFDGARPWDRRRAAGHRSAADRGSTFIRAPASWRAHDNQGGTGPKASACVRDRGAHRGDQRFDGGLSSQSDAAHGRYTVRGRGRTLMGVLGARDAVGRHALAIRTRVVVVVATT